MTNEEIATQIASDIYLNRIYGVKDVARVIEDALDMMQHRYISALMLIDTLLSGGQDEPLELRDQNLDTALENMRKAIRHARAALHATAAQPGAAEEER
jgi:hypothetical protein